MRIAQISTPHIPTPPPAYGGSELIASHITEELVRRGHEVTLFATPDSQTSARLASSTEAGQASSFDQRELVHVANAFKYDDDFDIIHNHCLSAGPALAQVSSALVVSTLHYIHNILRFFPGHNYIAVSHSQKRVASELNIRAVIHNAIDTRQFVFKPDKQDYLLFLGRFHPNKGAHLAIDVACRSGNRLLIAAPSPPHDQQDFFDNMIKPRLNRKIEYIGEVRGEVKSMLLANARALLLPLVWDEPFGLVMLEAMASGTPVIATNRGSVPEIVLPGKTGFIVDSIDEMVHAIERTDQIVPSDCQMHVEQNFSIERMADKYIAVYRALLNEEAAYRPKRHTA